MSAGPAVISAEVYRELSETGEFDTLSAEADEVRQLSCSLANVHQIDLLGRNPELLDNIADPEDNILQAEHSLELQMSFLMHMMR